MLYFCWCTEVALQGLYPPLPASLQLLGETLVKTATNRLLDRLSHGAKLHLNASLNSRARGRNKQRSSPVPVPGDTSALRGRCPSSLPCPYRALSWPNPFPLLAAREGRKKNLETSNLCFLFSLLNK